MSNSDIYIILSLNLLDNSRYKGLSVYELLLYSLLLNRTYLSKKNLKKFSDEKGIFVYYSNKEIKNALRCSDKKATKTLNNLENAELIRREYQQNGKPLKIYVNDVVTCNEKNDDIKYASHNGSRPFSQKYGCADKNVSFDVKEAQRYAQESLLTFGSTKNKKGRKRTTNQ